MKKVFILLAMLVVAGGLWLLVSQPVLSLPMPISYLWLGAIPLAMLFAWYKFCEYFEINSHFRSCGLVYSVGIVGILAMYPTWCIGLLMLMALISYLLGTYKSSRAT